jgi:hypothetical protein
MSSTTLRSSNSCKQNTVQVSATAVIWQDIGTTSLMQAAIEVIKQTTEKHVKKKEFNQVTRIRIRYGFNRVSGSG